jgi:hypothetical protein
MAKKLNAWLRKNHLTADANDFVAVPVTIGSAGIDEIADELVREGLELKRETVIDVITRFNRKTAEMAVGGYNVSNGLVHIRPSIKGAFYGKAWNPEVNSLVASISPGAALRTAIAETEVEILGEQPDMIEILSLTDTGTGKTDGTLTKGRNAEIKGSYLKIAGDDPSCGITFTNTATTKVTKLSAADIVLNEPSRLLILLPAALGPGKYELMVTTQFTSSGKLLKQPRSIVFGVPVTVK